MKSSFERRHYVSPRDEAINNLLRVTTKQSLQIALWQATTLVLAIWVAILLA